MTTFSSKRSKLIAKLVRPLISAGLIFGGLFQMVAPVLALGTAAGININNTATATFEDPNSPGVTRETVSNTVTVTIAEIAGITNLAQTPIDVNGGSVIFGDVVRYPFDITNTGNSATGIYIPNSVTSTNLLNPLIFIDTNNDGIPEYVIDPSDNSLSVADTNSDGVFEKGTTSIALSRPVAPETALGYVVPGIAADATIQVIVQGTVDPNAGAGGLVSVQLGNTGSNDSTNPNSQNQPDNGIAPDTLDAANEVRTIDESDNGDGTIDANEPINGDREAADTAEPLIVGTVPPEPLALATVEKIAASVDDQGDTNPVNDVIAYELSLSVANTLPLNYNGNFIPTNLVGTNISVGGATLSRILVSDAIPPETTLTGTPLAPVGWIVVYTASALTTPATAASWTTTAGATVTRVGFIRDGSVAAGVEVTGFEFSVVADNGVAPALTDTTPIYNLAQAFGQSDGDGDGNIVFDESGDPNPNNFIPNGTTGFLEPPTNNNGTPGDEPYGDYDPTLTTGNTGDPDAAAPGGVDANNNNSGAGADGEPNVVILNDPPEPPTPGVLLNGPLNQAAAVGPIGQDDDFTSKGINEGVTNNGIPITTIAPVVFNNSFRNTSGLDLENIVLLPLTEAGAAAVCSNCDYEITELPNGTRVTIALNVDADAAIEIAIFDLTAGAWVLNTTAANYTAARDVTGDGIDDTVAAYDNPNITGTINALELDLLGTGVEQDYNVVVDLPNGVVPPFQGFSIPLVAYINNDFNEIFTPATETINNITIDNLYTGYLKLTKEARILYANGTTSDWFRGNAVVGGSNPAPGDTIQYRITYENVSAAAPATGANNSILPANSVVIREYGLGNDPSTTTVTETNNWALDNAPIDNVIDTQNVVNATVASNRTIQFYFGTTPTLGTDQSGITANQDVTLYTNTVGTVNPGESGTFTFQRKISQ